MSLKSESVEVRRELWVKRRAEWWAKRRVEGSSEDVWDLRTYVHLIPTTETVGKMELTLYQGAAEGLPTALPRGDRRGRGGQVIMHRYPPRRQTDLTVTGLTVESWPFVA